jgi:hypothetical protein
MGGNLPPTRRAALESCHSTVKRGPVTQTGAESDQATAFQLVLKTAKTAQPCAIWAGERRGWDSNPRMTLTAIAGFQDRSGLAQQSHPEKRCAPFRALHDGESCGTMAAAARETLTLQPDRPTGSPTRPRAD